MYYLIEGACFYVELYTPFWSLTFTLFAWSYRSNNLEYSHYLRSLHTNCSLVNILNEKNDQNRALFMYY